MNNPGNSPAGKKDILLLIKNFGIDGPVSIYELNSGVINDTYIVESADKVRRFVLQKLHKIFSYNLLYDFEAVTAHLKSHSFVTPRLIYTLDGLPALRDGEVIWRMMTFVQGRTLKNAEVNTAKSAGSLLARFHGVLLSLDYEFIHAIPGFHDTEANINELKKTCSDNSQNKKYPELEESAQFVVDEYEEANFDFSTLPLRVVHGDPKISNFIFDSNEDNAISLIDLDTISKNNLAIELGDALRSWTQVQEENKIRFDKEIFKSFLQGYFLSAQFLTNGEISAIINGIKAVTLDLCARYITDAFKEVYFKLDHSRYNSLYEQNSAKASNLMGFYLEIQKSEQQLNSIISESVSGKN